jgi:hypothetical protein
LAIGRGSVRRASRPVGRLKTSDDDIASSIR